MSPAKPATRALPGGGQDGRTSSFHTITDFELVRNADGDWLLIVPELPERLLDNPLAEIRAELRGDSLFIFSHTANVEISNLLAQEYAAALRSDAPKELLLCAVDNEGMRRESLAVPLTID